MSDFDQYHHWVPQHYLRRFAVDQSTASKFRFIAQVLVNGRAKLVPQNVSKICGQDNWNRVTVFPRDPNALEKETSGFDGAVATAIRYTLERLELPLRSSEEGKDMIEFVARLIVRNDHNRRKQVAFQRRLMQSGKSLDEALRTPETWSDYLNYLAFAKTGLIPSATAYDQAVELHQKGKFSFVFDQTPVIAREMGAVNRICESIYRWRWFLRPVAHDAPDLITSDTPVQVWPGKDAIVPFTFGDTAILLPLSPRFLLASPGGPFMRESKEVTADEVAEINTRTFWAADAHVVSKTVDITLLDQSNALVNWYPGLGVALRQRAAYDAYEMQSATLTVNNHSARETMLFC